MVRVSDQSSFCVALRCVASRCVDAARKSIDRAKFGAGRSAARSQSRGEIIAKQPEFNLLQVGHFFAAN